jgi:hypothetical protein
VTILAACGYCLLTVWTTTDASLILPLGESELPVIGVGVPFRDFYYLAPWLVLAIFAYFQLQLQRLAERLGELPAFLPDGRRRLDRVLSPWPLVGLVSWLVPQLYEGRARWSWLQRLTSIALAWVFAPCVLLTLGVRSLVTADVVLLCSQGLAFLFSGVVAQRGWRDFQAAFLSPPPRGKAAYWWQALGTLCAVLLTSVAMWSYWDRPHVVAYGADLRGRRLSASNLSGAELDRSKLERTNLRGAQLCHASIRDSEQLGVLLACADLTG